MSVDTLTLARELRAADFANGQAEAIAAAIGRAVNETSATRADVVQLGTELRGEIAKQGGDLRTEIAKLDTKIESVRSSLLFWFIGTQLAIGGLVVALVKLIPA